MLGDMSGSYSRACTNSDSRIKGVFLFINTKNVVRYSKFSKLSVISVSLYLSILSSVILAAISNLGGFYSKSSCSCAAEGKSYMLMLSKELHWLTVVIWSQIDRTISFTARFLSQSLSTHSSHMRLACYRLPEFFTIAHARAENTSP